MNRVVVKIGSQTIVDESGDLDLKRLSQFIAQIAQLKKLGFQIVLVSSGAVASGIGITKHSGSIACSSEVVQRQILASLGQAKLIETYNILLKNYGLLASQILLTKQDFKTKTHYQNIARLFEELLATSYILPIVNENDTVAITELMFTDNDELASLVAAQIRAQQLVILTNVAGIYDKNPTDPTAKIIPVIRPKEDGWPKISAEKSTYGRGGMLSKLATARKMAQLGINTHIASAAEPNILIRIVQNSESLGTKIIANRVTSSVKRWLAYHPQASCVVWVNDCTSLLLKERQKVLSLLPIGITKVQGEFDKGDVVQILDETGQMLGIGMTNYGHESLKSCMGKKNHKAFIHYDKLYLY